VYYFKERKREKIMLDNHDNRNLSDVFKELQQIQANAQNHSNSTARRRPKKQKMPKVPPASISILPRHTI